MLRKKNTRTSRVHLVEARNEDAEKYDYSQYARSVDVLDDEFTIEEIDQLAVKHLKRGKAAGSDDIKSDYKHPLRT